MVSLCFPIFFHPDCTVGFGVSPNHALRLVGCTTGRESHPALKILDSISGSIIAWYIIECKPFLKPGQNRDGTTFRRRTLSRELAPSSSLSFCQSFHRVFLQAAESDVFSKVRVCEAQRSNESPSGAFKRQNGLAQQDGGASPRQVRICFSLTNTLPVCYLYSIETASLLTERCGAPQCRAAGMSMPTVWAALRNCCAKLSFFAIKEDV